MRTINEVEEFAKDPANRLRDGASWAAWCESFVSRAGDLQWYETALSAAKASGPLDPDPHTAKRGEFHYWSGVWIKGVECGHVAYETGNGILLMASSRVTAPLGVAMGYISWNDYAKVGLSYLGHSFRHGAQTLEVDVPLKDEYIASSDPKKGGASAAIWLRDIGERVAALSARPVVAPVVAESVPVAVDAAEVAKQLAANSVFVQAIAKAVNDDLHERTAS